jgi:hypothetical protein
MFRVETADGHLIKLYNVNQAKTAQNRAMRLSKRYPVCIVFVGSKKPKKTYVNGLVVKN